MRPLSTIIDTLFVFVLFMGCTLFFYYGILWVSDEYENYHRYDEPEGKAVKVIQPAGERVYDPVSVKDRLKLFYMHGE
ncbi:YqzK family protein [Alteribacter natronophilus]|uniref:YqzK family protein n=1 Tax=Alteribacter natronophilus TaxID=2583810 RepID=UPI00110ECE5A|nr:YqzK family protein [Alteribacter natronophilus]TMW73683.1 DUF4227 family protein [Alteribacter natronophilus]